MPTGMGHGVAGVGFGGVGFARRRAELFGVASVAQQIVGSDAAIKRESTRRAIVGREFPGGIVDDAVDDDPDGFNPLAS
jgi:hypothetical protein